MSDTYGLLTLPQASVGTPQTISLAGPDPALTLLTAYCKAVTNAVCGALYNLVDKDPVRGALPTYRAFTHDPREVELLETDLPALFVWREGDTSYRQVAAGYRMATSTVALLWVAPSDRQEKLVQRHPFGNALFKNLDRAFELGRDPSFRIVGDAEPQAATLGSAVWTAAQIASVKWMSWKRLPVANQETKEPYAGLFGTVELVERLEYGLGRYGDLNYIEGTIRTPDAGMGDGGKVLGQFHEER